MTLISAYTLLWSYLSAVFHFSIHWIWHLLPIIQRLRPFLLMTVGNKMWFLCLLNLQVYSNIFSSFKLFFFWKRHFIPLKSDYRIYLSVVCMLCSFAICVHGWIFSVPGYRHHHEVDLIKMVLKLMCAIYYSHS